MTHTARELPGYLTVRGASDRLRLAPRSVRDLIYGGRLPSARLGRRHYLRIADVDRERRRRLGLPLPARPRLPARSRAPRHSLREANLGAAARDGRTTAARERRRAALAWSPQLAAARRRGAAERVALLERWLRSGHRPEQPSLPFHVQDVTANQTCEACSRVVRAGGRMLDARAADGRGAARLCVPCARRALLAWADERRRAATAARGLARDLGMAPSPAPPLAAVA